MNNTDMETFWAVLEHGTLTAAAEALFITQPTLTNRIQALEARSFSTGARASATSS